jgi:hypothetical protein
MPCSCQRRLPAGLATRGLPKTTAACWRMDASPRRIPRPSWSCALVRSRRSCSHLSSRRQSSSTLWGTWSRALRGKCLPGPATGRPEDRLYIAANRLRAGPRRPCRRRDVDKIPRMRYSPSDCAIAPPVRRSGCAAATRKPNEPISSIQWLRLCSTCVEPAPAHTLAPPLTGYRPAGRGRGLAPRDENRASE